MPMMCEVCKQYRVVVNGAGMCCRRRVNIYCLGCIKVKCDVGVLNILF